MKREQLSVFGAPRATRFVRNVGIGFVSVVVLCSSALPTQADELDDRREELNSSLAGQAQAVDHASGELSAASAALEAAQAELSDAEGKLQVAEAATRESQALDAARAEELVVAEHKLVQAEADVAAAQAALDSVEARTAEEIVVITQQNGPLLNLALLFTEVSAAELNQRAQLSTTLFDSSALELDELTERQFALEIAKGKADEAKVVASDARQAAADQLLESEAKEAEADALRNDVALKVAAQDAAAAEAERQLTLEQSRQQDLEAESAEVDQRIAERIAEQKRAEEAAAAEALRVAAAEEAQRAEAAAASARAAAQAAKQNTTSSRPAPAPVKPQAPAAKPNPPAASSSSSFQMPASGRISSSYGMRTHPILGYRKLHDGTDVAASCNAPLRAAADGVVSERYFNAGYGNRLMIDHGKVNGRYVTTGLNHATRYTVSVGQRVSKGQIVGYVGTTGYSTGCHLHLMVWENGSLVNPMAKWFR